MVRINMDFAQQIVDSAKTIVGWNVNFIDPQGIILASTDSKRIGTYHEAGHLAARTRQTRTVYHKDEYKGSNSGINYPITMNDQVVGVIGITGEPNVVGQYGFLLTKICEVFMKEYLLEIQSYDDQQRIGKLVMALLYHDLEGIQQIMGDADILADEKYVAISYMLDCLGDGQIQPQIERNITENLQELELPLHVHIYPNMVVCLVPESKYKKWKQRVAAWETAFSPKLYIGVGTWEAVRHIYLSYRFSRMAMKYAKDHQFFCMFAENMNLELLLQSIDEQVQRQYVEKVCTALNEEEFQLLQTYFKNELSLQSTANEMMIHKNTLQYRLKQIYVKTGLDPRKFTNAVVLYIGVNLKK